MNAPQLIVIGAWFISLGIHATRHGEIRKQERYNFFIQMASILFNAAILYWGGFFK